MEGGWREPGREHERKREREREKERKREGTGGGREIGHDRKVHQCTESLTDRCTCTLSHRLVMLTLHSGASGESGRYI